MYPLSLAMNWAQKDVRKKDELAPLRARMQREGRTGVYYVLKSMEQGPKFAQHERDGMDLRRYYFISQIEHAKNVIFKRNHPIHSIFERSCGSRRVQTTSRTSARKKHSSTYPRWAESYRPSMIASPMPRPRT